MRNFQHYRSGGYVLAWGFLLLMALTVHTNAQSCETLDLVTCEASPVCTHRIAIGGPLGEGICVSEPIQFCQEGLQQADLDGGGKLFGWSEATIAYCENKDRCEYVPAGPCYCPPELQCVCGGGAPPSCRPSVEN